MKVTNNSQSATYTFVKAGGNVTDGVPETVSVGPGQTVDVDVAESELPRLEAAVAFGDLAESGKDEPASRGRQKPPEVI